MRFGLERWPGLRRRALLATGAACASAALLFPGTAAAVTFARSDVLTGDRHESVAVGDFNRDGDPDLALASGGHSRGLTVLLGQAGGDFGPVTEFTTGAAPQDVAVGDFNADGDLDVVVANEDSGGVSVLLGQPGGDFAPKTDFLTGSQPQAVAVGDFNGDGDPDLAVTNRGHDDVSVLLGEPGGSFAPMTDFDTGESPHDVAVDDFNGDGDPDLVVANQSDDTVSVLLGQAGGDFGPKSDFATGHAPESLAVGEFNGDGNPDLAVGGASDGVSVLLGQPNGGFAARTDIATGGGPQSVAVGDLNGDGDPDLTVANGGANNVSVLPGQAGGGFGPKTDFATGDFPRSVAVADFNGDGDRDLAVANRSPGSVTVLLNTSPPAVSPSPTSVGFPTTPVGSTSPRQDVTITNSGEGSLVVTAVAIAGGDADQFLISGETCTEGRIPPGDSCTISVRFRPVAEGPATATLRITDNAPDSPQRVTLTGTAGPPPAPAFSANPSSLTFANQRVRTTSAPRPVTVVNTGTGPLAIASTAIGGASSADFAIAADTCKGQTVAPGAACEVRVVFRPTATGLRSGSLVFIDNAVGSPHAVALTGRGCLLVTAPVCL